MSLTKDDDKEWLKARNDYLESQAREALRFCGTRFTDFLPGTDPPGTLLAFLQAIDKAVNRHIDQLLLTNDELYAELSRWKDMAENKLER